MKQQRNGFITIGVIGNRGSFMRKMLFGFLMIAVLALGSCVLSRKAEIVFNNYSSYSVCFYVNGFLVPTNPIYQTTKCVGLDAGSYTIVAVPSPLVVQSEIITVTFYILLNEVLTFNVSRGSGIGGLTYQHYIEYF
jgi:hypothetical protein